ncbi:MAG: polysaccharide biosynthesis/export family protein [Desulfomonilaceae bacterium]|nr:polysaccharide biosynthesis/export family protein [Desulfomonilaceae bacterium]
MSMHTDYAVFGISWRKLVVIPLAVLLFGGCVIPRHRAVVNETPPAVGAKVTQHFPVSLYRLAHGDILEFIYLTLPSVSGKPYQLQVKDQIDIEFDMHPQLNRTVRVRPDGEISIPRKKDVKVAGMTADQVSQMLRKRYSDILKDPEITVTVREFNTKLDEIQKAIATAPYGQARIVTIRPDGHLSAPLIEDLAAAGRTVPELNRAVNATYSKIVPEMRVSVLLREVVGNLVFVDGEVFQPGVFNVKGPITLQHALAKAGGTKDTAEPRSVLVISRMPDGKFFTRKADLTNMTSHSDFMLQRNDLVYVPKSVIARADIWVQQNISRLLLFQGWNVGLQSDLGRVTVR